METHVCNGNVTHTRKCIGRISKSIKNEQRAVLCLCYEAVTGFTKGNGITAMLANHPKIVIEFREGKRQLVIPSVSVVNKQKHAPELFQVYLDLKDVVIHFMDNNIDVFNINTIHAYTARCIKVLLEHDAIFLAIMKTSAVTVMKRI
eukprot:1625521-Ditylum_brightwellii.AAC.1